MNIGKDELVQRSRRGLGRAIFSRTGLILLLFLVQAGLLVSVMVWFQEWQAHVVGGSVALTMIAVLVVLNSDLDPTAKLTWMAVMTFFPVFGALFYWYTRRDVGHRLLKSIMAERQVQRRHPGTLVDQPDGTAHMGGHLVDGLGNNSIGLRQQEAREEGIGSEQALSGSGNGFHQVLEQHGKVCLGFWGLGIHIQTQTFQNHQIAAV